MTAKSEYHIGDYGETNIGCPNLSPIMYDHVFQTSYCVLVSGDELNNDKAPIYNVQWWNVIIIILCNLVINYLIKFIFHVEGCKGWKRLID